MTLFQGILTGKYSTLAEIPLMQRRTRHFKSAGNPKIRHGEQGYEEETAAALERVRAVSQKHGITMLQLAIRWSVYSGITCALAGARNGKQMEANLKALDIQINEDIVQELNEATGSLKERLGNHFDLWESRENDRTK
jgi:aryl-alcohol dehydrogenase-like predicted oxidoreductase